MRRWIILTVALAVLALLAVPCAALYYVTFTEGGLQRIAGFIPHRLGGVQLDIVGIRGSAAHGVHIDRIEIEHERVHLRFEGIDGRVTLAPLLLQTLRVPEATIQSASILVRHPTHVTPPWGWRFLPHWLEIRADRLRILKGVLVVPNGQRYDATELEGSGIVRARTVRLFAAAMNLDNVRCTARGILRAADPMQLDAETRISVRAAGQPTWIFDATGKGDLDSLALNVRFDAPLRAEFVGRAADLTDKWHWQGAARVDDFDLRAWGGSAALGQVTGKLAVQGDASGFSARGPLTPAGLHVGAFETLFRGSYANRVFTASRIEVTHLASGVSVDGSGSIAIVAGGPKLDLAGAWKEFRWPLTGKNPALRSPSGEYVLEGILPFELRGMGKLALRGRDPMEVMLSGVLGKDRLLIDEGSLTAPEGRLDLSGAVAWTPVPAWSASGTASEVNPATLRPDLPGRLSFGFDVRARASMPERISRSRFAT